MSHPYRQFVDTIISKVSLITELNCIVTNIFNKIRLMVSFWATVSKTVHSMPSDRCLSCL